MAESLLQRIRGRALVASLFTSYAFTAPFYEAVVLRRVRASGSRLNLVLTDARQLAGSLVDPLRRPRVAGHEYALLPISRRGGGAFHPKVGLLVGARGQVTVLVGSHNMTHAGFTGNAELTNILEVDADSSLAARASLASVWTSVREWLAMAPSPDVDTLVEVFESHLEPLIRDVDSSSSAILCSTPERAALVDQLAPHIDGQVEQLVVVGPFFDAHHQLLTDLAERFSPKQTVVAVDARRTANLCGPGRTLPNVQFCHAAHLVPDDVRRRDTVPYIHAKALALRLMDGRGILVTGSANPSAPAWLEHPRANAEAVFVRKLAADALQAHGLGLFRQDGWIPLSDEDWQQAGTELPAAVEEAPESSRAVRLALIDSHDRLWIPWTSTTPPNSVHITDVDAHSTDMQLNCDVHDEQLRVALDRSQTARLLEAGVVVARAAGQELLLLVHERRRLQRLALSDRQLRYSHAMDRLRSGTFDLGEVLAVIEDVLFAARVDGPPPRARAGHAGSAASLATIPTPDLLESADEAPSDIELIIEAVLATGDEAPRADEQELRGEELGGDIDQDDDDVSTLDTEQVSFSSEDAAAFAARIQHRLDKRCIREDAKYRYSTLSIPALVGLLGLLRILRQRQRERDDLTICPDELLISAFDVILPVLEVLAERDNLDEVEHHLVSLVLWVAWELQLDRTLGVVDHERRGMARMRGEHIGDRLLVRAAIVRVMSLAARFSVFEASARLIEATNVPELLVGARTWLKEHESWGKRLLNASHFSSKRLVGDLVYWERCKQKPLVFQQQRAKVLDVIAFDRPGCCRPMARKFIY